MRSSERSRRTPALPSQESAGPNGPVTTDPELGTTSAGGGGGERTEPQARAIAPSPVAGEPRSGSVHTLRYSAVTPPSLEQNRLAFDSLYSQWRIARSTPPPTGDPLGFTQAEYEYFRRFAYCRYATISGQAVITAREGRIGTTGLQTCGRALCVGCSPALGAERGSLIGLALFAFFHLHPGGAVYFPTDTIQHDRSMSLAACFSALTGSLAAVKDSKRLQALRQELGSPLTNDQGEYLPASIRRYDTTWGPEYGWHAHAHGLDFFTNPARAEEYYRERFKVRDSYLRRHGHQPLSAAGYKVVRVTLENADQALALYMAKGAGHELAHGVGKTGNGEHLTVFELIAAASATEGQIVTPAQAAELVREAWLAFKGRRWLRWSPGLKVALLGQDIPELTDAQAVEAFETGTGLLALDHQAYAVVRDHRNEHGHPAQAVIKRRGEIGLQTSALDAQRLIRWYLDQIGVTYHAFDLNPREDPSCPTPTTASECSETTPAPPRPTPLSAARESSEARSTTSTSGPTSPRPQEPSPTSRSGSSPPATTRRHELAPATTTLRPNPPRSTRSTQTTSSPSSGRPPAAHGRSSGPEDP